jgi:hypothetical protein
MRLRLEERPVNGLYEGKRFQKSAAVKQNSKTFPSAGIATAGR